MFGILRYGMPERVCFWAEAGGVGKTTFAMNTAAALGRMGHDVLVIDLDHQRATLTEWAGFGHLTDTPSSELNIVSAMIDEEHSLADVAVEAAEFDLIPSHTDLALFERKVAGDGAPIFFLRNEVDALRDEYDYFVVDAPASRGLLSDNALVAMQNLLVPMPMGHKGYESVRGIEDTVEALEGGLQKMPGNISLSILGIIPNRVGEMNIEKAAKQALEDEGTLFVPLEFRERGVLEKAWNEHLSIFEYDEEYGLSDYESDLLEQFPKLATLITGEWVPVVDDSELSDGVEAEV